jgi:hypothetical protein
LRTREAFAAGTDEAEMADGGKRVLAVFELLPAMR